MSWVLGLIGIALLIMGCGATPSGSTCASPTGTVWTPAITGASNSNHDATASVSKTVVSASGPVMGLGQAVPTTSEISVSIDMTSDLGAYGSLTLVAQVENYPAALSGSAFPMLVSLHDGTNELINMARAGSGGDCVQSGYYTCSGSSCSVNTSCKPNWPSAYHTRSQWEIRQAPNVSAANSPSTNIFPTCNFTGGSTVTVANPECAFNSTFFPVSAPVRLRSGVTYTARYVLLADSYVSLSGKTATLKVSYYKKTDATATVGGAVDLNVVLVGNDVINAGRTAKGQQNLNTLVTRVGEYLDQTSTGVKLGTVRGVEWNCAAGGDSYANVNLSVLGNMFAAGGGLMPSGSEGKALNLFLVNSIVDDTSSGSGTFTILGIDGALPGPPMNSTAVSGATVATFGSLATYNPNCTGTAVCSVANQEAGFSQLAVVVTHELGHYFGLNHLSESSGTYHDMVGDTPICTATQSVSGSNIITVSSCLNTDSNVYPTSGNTCLVACPGYNSTAGSFCPTALECEFNHIMWWTSKNFKAGTANSDGNLFSTHTARIINYSPFVQ